MRLLTNLRYLSCLLWLTTRVAFVAAQAPSPALPHATLELSSGHPLSLTLEVAAGAVSLHAGTSSVPLPLSQAPAGTTLEAETVMLKGGSTVGIVRVSAASQKAAVLLVQSPAGALTTLWTGRLDLHGDPGERRADALEVGDRDGDKLPDVVVGTYDEQVRVCGAERTLLGARAVDPKTLGLRSVLLNQSGERSTAVQLVASATPRESAQPVPPMLRALRIASASSTATDMAYGAAALIDGDLASSWVEGRGLGGRFEFVTLSWTAPGRPITALAVVPVAATTTGTPATGATKAGPSNATARVRTLSVLGPKGERLAVTLPDTLKPGERYWISPATALAWTCLTVMVDSVAAEGLTARTHSGLAELEAYTALDSAHGVADLIAELAQPGTRGDDATTLLQQLRSDPLDALASAWPTLPSVGKRRALRLVSQTAFQPGVAPDPRSQMFLRSALHDPDRELRELAFKIATDHVQSTLPLLVELAHEATGDGDHAARMIAHSGAQNAFESLLPIIAEPSASERSVLREALAVAYQASSSDLQPVLTNWSTADAAVKPAAARVALVLALAQSEKGHALANRWLSTLVQDARQTPELQLFQNQWRMVQAATQLSSQAAPDVDAWLGDISQHAQAWMLRAAALEALERRNHVLGMHAATRALTDDYPRVRASAVTLLASSAHDFEPLQKTVQDDPWFLVRRAPLDKLPDSPAARAFFVEAISDRTPAVRAAAIAALRRVGAQNAWTDIAPLLEKSDELPEVIAEGITFARALCVGASSAALKTLVSRGLAPDAANADQELGLSALEALSALSGDAAIWARNHARGPNVPKAVQLTAAKAAARKGGCQREPNP